MWIDPRKSKRPFGEWSAEWFATTVHLRPNTRVRYESILKNHLDPYFGRKHVATIDQPLVRRFISEMANSGSAPGTIRAARNVLRQVLATAVGARAIATNPCDGTRVPRSNRQEMHFLTPPQVEELAHAIASPALRSAGNDLIGEPVSPNSERSFVSLRMRGFDQASWKRYVCDGLICCTVGSRSPSQSVRFPVMGWCSDRQRRTKLGLFQPLGFSAMN